MQIIVLEAEKKRLYRTVNTFDRVCMKRKMELELNVSKSVVMVLGKAREQTDNFAKI